MYFELHRNPNTQQFRFLIKSSGNHQVLATSESYVSKQGALNAMEVIANGQSVEIVDVIDATS